jgi:hypothetical protein
MMGSNPKLLRTGEIKTAFTLPPLYISSLQKNAGKLPPTKLGTGLTRHFEIPT